MRLIIGLIELYKFSGQRLSERRASRTIVDNHVIVGVTVLVCFTPG